jgi:hypothetical protein
MMRCAGAAVTLLSCDPIEVSQREPIIDDEAETSAASTKGTRR